MFATPQQTSSGQRTLVPPPTMNRSRVESLTDEERKNRPRFYCFYCNDLSFSKEELQYHMTQRHSRTFKCPACVFESTQKESVLRHIQVMHPPSIQESLLKVVRAQTQASVSNPSRHPVPRKALNQPTAPTGTSIASARPFVQIIASGSETNLTGRQENGHGGNTTMEANMLPKDQVKLSGPLNARMDGPLTIALPDEVNIQAGSFVELIEVNTVNGKKELKLRLVPPQQPTVTIVIDDGGCGTAPQKATTTFVTGTSNTTPNRAKTTANNRLTVANSGRSAGATTRSPGATTIPTNSRLPPTTAAQSTAAAFTTIATREKPTGRLPPSTAVQSTAAAFITIQNREKLTGRLPLITAVQSTAAAFLTIQNREKPTVRLPVTTTVQSTAAAFTTIPTREKSTGRLPLTTTVQSTAAAFTTIPTREKPTVNNRQTLAAPVTSAGATRLSSTTNKPTREMPTLNQLLLTTTTVQSTAAAFIIPPTREKPPVNRETVAAAVGSAAATAQPTRKNVGWDRPCTANGLTPATNAGSAAMALATVSTREKPASDGRCTVNRPTVKRGSYSSRHIPQTSTDRTNQYPHSLIVVEDPLDHTRIIVEDAPIEGNSKASAVQVSEIKVEEVKLEDVTSGPETLPVISCVFSLSREKWENDESCPQPFLMALQQMAEINSTPSVKTSLVHEKQTFGMATTHEKNTKTSNANHKLDVKALSTVQKINQKAGHQKQNEMVGEHCEDFRTPTLNPSFAKEVARLEMIREQRLSPSVVNGTTSVCTNTFAMSVKNDATSPRPSHRDPGRYLESVQQRGTDEQDLRPGSSSYVTIPLKRIKLDETMQIESTSNEKQHITLNLRREEKMGEKVGKKQWKVSRSRRRTRSLDSPGNFLCLREDQHVKEPGPNQPVVVLNLARPQTLRRKAGMDSLTDMADPEVIPTCHILKMKLNKVMGQKYEVSGCTVRLCDQER